jgi:hypothetical protein
VRPRQRAEGGTNPVATLFVPPPGPGPGPDPVRGSTNGPLQMEATGRGCACAPPRAARGLAALQRAHRAPLPQAHPSARTPHPRAPRRPPRSAFERGIAYCSSDFSATPLWERYLAFEQQRGTPASVAVLFVRALQCPLEGLDRLEAG